jgi:hypothetical protein
VLSRLAAHQQARMRTRALAVQILDGAVPYAAALRAQETLAARRHAGEIADTLLVLQVRAMRVARVAGCTRVSP